jgi:sulfite reductase alpha subunit-like flavoprotein
VTAKKSYIPFRLLSRRRLSTGSGKEICEIILLAEEPIAYEPGDWLALLPVNDAEDVSCMLRQMNASGGDIAIRDALASHLAIGEVSRHRQSVKVLAIALTEFSPLWPSGPIRLREINLD